MITYLSPTSYSLYKSDKEKFFIRYLSGIKAPSEPQNQAMSIGSAFDAYVKNYLFEGLFGKNVPEYEKYRFEALFESMVEEHNRDWALENGKYVFEIYKKTGALGDLFTEINKGSSPRFEFKIGGSVSGYREGRERIIKEVPLSGKPDVSFINEEGLHVILDFKVNGYVSKYNVSPLRGYVRMRGMNVDFGSHKDAILGKIGGITVNLSDTLDQVKTDWAEQLAIYAWLCGENIGNTDFIIGIDQLVCNGSNGGMKLPSIKVAEHRLKISEKFQNELFENLVDAWEVINSDWFFRDMSPEDSIKRCEMLKELYSPKDSDDPWIGQLLR